MYCPFWCCNIPRVISLQGRVAAAYHPSCSAKMGKEDDSMTVVNSNCQVLGVQNLRVVDSSIMPSVASGLRIFERLDFGFLGNLNAPTIAIAERAADIIRRMKPLVSRFLKRMTN